MDNEKMFMWQSISAWSCRKTAGKSGKNIEKGNAIITEIRKYYEVMYGICHGLKNL